MEQKKLYRFNITPQTSVRSTQGDRIYFRIPRAKLQPAGLKRLCRLERYNQYKEDFSALCKEQGFTLPFQGAHIRFYIPCPRTWSQKKKNQFHSKLHTSRPDIDNMCKGIMDSLFYEDKDIADLRLTKFWVDCTSGWIEIEVSTPEFPEILRTVLHALNPQEEPIGA